MAQIKNQMEGASQPVELSWEDEVAAVKASPPPPDAVIAADEETLYAKVPRPKGAGGHGGTYSPNKNAQENGGQSRYTDLDPYFAGSSGYFAEEAAPVREAIAKNPNGKKLVEFAKKFGMQINAQSKKIYIPKEAAKKHGAELYRLLEELGLSDWALDDSGSAGDAGQNSPRPGTARPARPVGMTTPPQSQRGNQSSPLGSDRWVSQVRGR